MLYPPELRARSGHCTRPSPFDRLSPPIPAILAPIAHVFTPIAHVFPTVDEILHPIAPPAIVLRVASIFLSIALVLRAIARVLAPVPAILETIESIATRRNDARPAPLRADCDRCYENGRESGHQCALPDDHVASFGFTLLDRG